MPATITLRMTKEQHTHLKVLAFRRNMSVNKYIRKMLGLDDTNLVLQKPPSDNPYLARELPRLQDEKPSRSEIVSPPYHRASPTPVGDYDESEHV